MSNTVAFDTCVINRLNLQYRLKPNMKTRQSLWQHRGKQYVIEWDSIRQDNCAQHVQQHLLQKHHVILATSDNLQKNYIQHSFILNNVIDIVFKHAENTILYLPQCATTHSLFVNNYEHTNCLARVMEELATKTTPYRVCDKLWKKFGVVDGQLRKATCNWNIVCLV